MTDIPLTPAPCVSVSTFQFHSPGPDPGSLTRISEEEKGYYLKQIIV